MSAEQALQAMARNCIAQILANETGVIGCQDAEFVHQMRIGLRRH
jgi:triphosphatase